MKEVSSFRAGVKKMAANTYSIKAAFSQSKHVSILSNKLEAKGTMFFKKPNLLKWSYTEPYNYAVLLNGNEVKINDEGKVNSFGIQNSKVFREMNDLIVNSVQGNVLREDKFDISYYENEKLYLAKLKPKEKSLQEYIERIDIYFEKSDFTVNKLQLHEPEGDYTMITFNNKELNGSIPDNEFTFK